MFYIISLLMAADCLFMGCVLAFAPARFKALPRLRWAGEILGIACLAWSAWHGCNMLEGGAAKFHAIVWCLVPLTAVLAWFYLDYLFARANGGFFVLSANELIRQAFAADIHVRPLYSAICLLLGVCGLFMLGTPWRMRDAIALAERNTKFGRAIAAAFGVAGLLLALLPLFRR